MNPHHVPRLTGVLLIFSSLIIVLSPSILAQQEEDELYGPCSPPDRLVGTNGAAWAHNATVTVTINSNDFPTTAERQAIQAAFIAWQNANTNSGVTFTFTTGTTVPNSANTFFVSRGSTQNGAATSISNTGSPTTSGNITTHASTVIDPRVTASHAITSFMTHEIGHTFGLGDCFTCTPAASMMSPPQRDCNCEDIGCDTNEPFNNTHWGCPPLQHPRWCDDQKVNEYAADYPTPTPAPTPTPTPCAGEGQACNGDDCCDGFICGEQTSVCIPCERDPNNPSHGCMSERCISCYDGEGVYCDPWNSSCYTPLIVDVDGDGFHLTDLNDGVRYDAFGHGITIQSAWTKTNSDDAWLVLDRNGNEQIDNGTEMFSSVFPQPEPSFPDLKNGFNALVQFDKSEHGGNGDGMLDQDDQIFSSLRLWQDSNHNGVGEPSELHTLSELGLSSIEMTYKQSKKQDQYGNRFKYRAKLKDKNGAQLGRWLYDVYLLARP